MEEKLYFIVDATKPADDSLVKIDGDMTILSLEEAQAFIDANQVDLDLAQELDNGIVITKRYNLFEAPAQLPSTE